MMNSMMNLFGKALIKGIKVAGRELSKKTMYIAGGVAGTAALAGGTTAVVIHRKHKKENNAEENTTEETTTATDEADQAPVEEAGAEKIDAEVSNSEPATATPAENTTANNATEPKDNVVDVAKVIEEKKVETPAVPVEEKKVEEVKQTVAPQPQIINPAPAGPNPVFQMYPGMMQQQPQAPFGMAPMSFPPFGMPQNQQPSFQGPVQQNNPMVQPNNQVEVPADEKKEVAEIKEVNEEQTTVTPLAEEVPIAEEEETIVWTPADAINGTAGKQKGKTKKTKIQKPALEIPMSAAPKDHKKSSKKK